MTLREVKTPGGGGEKDSFHAADAGSIRAVLLALKEFRFDPALKEKREGFKDRQGNMHYFDYYPWDAYADALDTLCPEWEYRIDAQQVIGDMCVTIASIGIVGYEPDGRRIQVWRSGTGCGKAESETGIKKADSDALKRAAVKFGLARELYREEAKHEEREGAARPAFGGGPGADKPTEFLSKNERDKASGKQLGMLRARIREAGGDPTEVCQKAFGCTEDELNKKACSWLIDNFAAVMEEAGEHITDSAGGEVPHCQHGPAKYIEWEDTKGQHAAYVCPQRGTAKDCKFARRTEPIPF